MKILQGFLWCLLVSLVFPAFAEQHNSPLQSRELDRRIIEKGGSGGYFAVMLSDRSLAGHTIFRPEKLADHIGKKRLPIIVWGNGSCIDSPFEHINFLNEIASHGFLVIATGSMPKEQGEQNKERSTSAKMLQAIDWAVAQNADQSSPYFKRLDINHIAAAGMSCGGLQALEIAADPRISTLLVANSGIFIDPVAGTLRPGLPQLDKSHLAKIHTPTLYLLGGPSDIAYKNGMDDVARITHVPVAVANLDVGHGGTYSQPYGGDFAKVATVWFKFQLKGKRRAGSFFTGRPPGITRMPGWAIYKKNFP